jgi:hypothetical protein
MKQNSRFLNPACLCCHALSTRLHAIPFGKLSSYAGKTTAPSLS